MQPVYGECAMQVLPGEIIMLEMSYEPCLLCKRAYIETQLCADQTVHWSVRVAKKLGEFLSVWICMFQSNCSKYGARVHLKYYIVMVMRAQQAEMCIIFFLSIAAVEQFGVLFPSPNWKR
jgi:hypothetical protein